MSYEFICPNCTHYEGDFECEIYGGIVGDCDEFECIDDDDDDYDCNCCIGGYSK